VLHGIISHYDVTDNFITLIWFYVDGPGHLAASDIRKPVLFKNAAGTVDDADAVAVLGVSAAKLAVRNYDVRIMEYVLRRVEPRANVQSITLKSSERDIVNYQPGYSDRYQIVNMLLEAILD
jgi:hypothetical protein